MKKLLLRLPAIAIALTIFVLSSKSSLPLPQTIKHIDKVMHFIAFFSLGISFCLWFSFATWKTKTLRTALFVVILVSLYGALDEFHQFFVPYRVPSISDWIADTLGASLAVIVYGTIIRLVIKRKLWCVTDFES